MLEDKKKKKIIYTGICLVSPNFEEKELFFNQIKNYLEKLSNYCKKKKINEIIEFKNSFRMIFIQWSDEFEPLANASITTFLNKAKLSNLENQFHEFKDEVQGKLGTLEGKLGTLEDTLNKFINESKKFQKSILTYVKQQQNNTTDPSNEF